MANIKNFKIKVDSVMQVYSGKPGCMCGCNGIYRVASKHLNAADIERGYPHDDPKDVNDRFVRRVVKLIEAQAAQFGVTFDENANRATRSVIVTGEYVTFEADDHVYAAYFAPTAEELKSTLDRRAAAKAAREAKVVPDYIANVKTTLGVGDAS